MTIEEIKTEMKQLETKIEQLSKELEMAERESKRKSVEVPETLDWEDGDTYYYSTYYGVESARYTVGCDGGAAYAHTIFPTANFAEIFNKKTQFIADLLYFKWLYDRDFKPDWNNEKSQKWCVFYNSSRCEYDVGFDFFCSSTADIYFCSDATAVYFSSQEIAKKCADWLNSKNVHNKKG